MGWSKSSLLHFGVISFTSLKHSKPQVYITLIDFRYTDTIHTILGILSRSDLSLTIIIVEGWIQDNEIGNEINVICLQDIQVELQATGLI